MLHRSSCRSRNFRVGLHFTMHREGQNRGSESSISFQNNHGKYIGSKRNCQAYDINFFKLHLFTYIESATINHNRVGNLLLVSFRYY